MAGDPWEARNKWGEPYDGSSLLFEQFPGYGTGKEIQREPGGSPTFRRQVWESREDKAVESLQAEAGRELHRVRSPEICNGCPLRLQLSRAQHRGRYRRSGENHQRIRVNNTQDSCKARNNSCSHQSFESLIIHAEIGSVLKRVCLSSETKLVQD